MYPEVIRDVLPIMLVVRDEQVVSVEDRRLIDGAVVAEKEEGRVERGWRPALWCRTWTRLWWCVGERFRW